MKKILLTLVAFMATVAVSAEQVSKHQALQKAQQFMPGKQFGEARSFARSGGAIEGEPFYVFNAEGNQGFVIVSGDDRTTEILGYSKTGSLDLNHLPENLKGWLDGYARQIEALGTSTKPVQKAKVRGVDSWAAIAPLIQTKWNQSEPYNLMCPDGNYVDFDEDGYDADNRCVTGCVATAMAQIIYYWQCQDVCDAIDKYDIWEWINKGTDVNPDWQLEVDHSFHGLDATTFDWESMALTYPSNATGASANAVAKLLRYCGQAVEMDYGTGRSSANISPAVMAKYFGFGKNARQVSRSMYSSSEWENMIYMELSSADHPRPVLYGGSSLSGGHRFIIDGYDGNGLFHMNWGWGGMSDGFFVLSLANPDELGAGGGASKDGYSRYQDAIIGLKPAIAGEVEIPLFYGNLYDDPETSSFSRMSTSEDFTDVVLPGYVFFQYEDYTKPGEWSFETAWGLFQNGSLLDVVGASEPVTKQKGNIAFNDSPLSFGHDLDDGQYQFRQMYRLQGSTEWLPCEAPHDFYGNPLISFIEAVVSDKKLILRVSEPDEYTSDITVNSITFYPAPLEAGKPVEVTVNLTNNGNSYQELVFLSLGDQKTVVCGSVEAGKTGNVKLHLIPSEAGTMPLKVSTDYDATNEVWSESVTVEAAKPQSLSGTMVIDNFDKDNRILHGTTFKMAVNVKNEGDNPYENAVVLELYEVLPGETYGYSFKSKSVMASIEPGETKTLVLTIPGLNLDNRYFFIVSYSSSGVNVPLGLPLTQMAFSLDASLPGDADGNGEVNAADIDAVVRYIMEGDFDGFNFDNANLSGDDNVDAADLVLLINMVP